MTIEMLEIMAMMAGENLPDFQEQIRTAKRDAMQEIERIVRGASSFDQEYVPYIEYAEQLISESQIELVNIRAFDIDKEMKVCKCGADVITGIIDHEFSLEYTAEYTLDDASLVEVYL